MNRSVLFTLLISSTLAPLSASPAPLVIDLDEPGALRVVQQQRPADYREVVGILHDAESLPQSQVVGWVRTEYRADSVQFSGMLLVSLPPKRRLSFALGETSYTATVNVSMSPTTGNAK